MLSFSKLNIKKILQYMDFLKNNSPRHRFRFSQQAWLSQDKTADPVLRRLHERLIRLKYCKVTNIERGPVFLSFNRIALQFEDNKMPHVLLGLKAKTVSCFTESLR